MIFATSNYQREGDMYPICSMYIFTYIWLILFGQMLGNIPAPWSIWVWLLCYFGQAAVFSTLCGHAGWSTCGRWARPGNFRLAAKWRPKRGTWIHSATQRHTAPHSATCNKSNALTHTKHRKKHDLLVLIRSFIHWSFDVFICCYLVGLPCTEHLGQ